MEEDRTDAEALAEEFVPTEDELTFEIYAQWDAMHKRGEQIRVGDASRAARL
jgi:hypothetical protein